MSKTPGDLQQQVEEFGQETAELLLATLPGLPDPPVQILRRENRSLIGPLGSKPLPLYANGKHLGDMKISIACELDSVGQYLAVQESTFNLVAVLDRAPVLRIYYRRETRCGRPLTCTFTATAAHCLLLSQAGHDSPHDMSSLHLPLGGNRFRPCLEDFTQFLICECRFYAQPGWQKHVEAGRERWRCRLAAAVVRDVPERGGEGSSRSWLHR